MDLVILNCLNKSRHYTSFDRFNTTVLLAISKNPGRFLFIMNKQYRIQLGGKKNYWTQYGFFTQPTINFSYK